MSDSASSSAVTVAPGAAPAPPKSAAPGLGLDELLSVTGPRTWIALLGLLVLVAGAIVWSVVGVLPEVVSGEGILMRGSVQHIVAPADGTIAAISASENSEVATGAVVGTLLQTDGTTVTLTAAQAGVVTGLNVLPGFTVQKGATIMIVEEITSPLQAVIYVPLTTGKKVAPGMTVQLAPSVTDVNTYGYLLGTVQATSQFPITEDDLVNEQRPAALLPDDQALLQMLVTLDTANNASGYRWSSSSGPDYQLRNGTQASARILVAQKHPIDYFLDLNR